MGFGRGRTQRANGGLHMLDAGYSHRLRVRLFSRYGADCGSRLGRRCISNRPHCARRHSLHGTALSHGGGRLPVERGWSLSGGYLGSSTR